MRSLDIDRIVAELEAKKRELNFYDEIKWQKVTSNYLEKYISIIDLFLSFVAQDKIKIRIMFTQNYIQAINLTKEQREKEFFILYYQFLKHAFGLKYCSEECGAPVGIRIYFDKLPDTKAKVEEFKEFIFNIQNIAHFRESGLSLKKEDIAEVTSHDHVILQCMDIVLGSIFFRLNNLHLEKPEGSRRRGKRTIAKEKLYKYINKKVRGIYPNLNIGITTGINGEFKSLWDHQYRHWLFRPHDYEINLNGPRKHKN